MYTNQGGSKGNRSRFISKLKDHMNEEKKASHSVNAVFFCFFFLKLTTMMLILQCVSFQKKIKEEIRKLPRSKNEYNVIENTHETTNLTDKCSETLMTLLSKLSPNIE